jgi:uncharacterized protein (TIGR03437 family)
MSRHAFFLRVIISRGGSVTFRVFCLLVWLWTVHPSAAQVISKVVNAASLQPQFSPGCLAIITGTSLDAGMALSSVYPASVGGKMAFVVSFSSTQFTIQIPVDAPLGPTGVQVGRSAPFAITLTEYSPALFTSSGQGSGNISGVHQDGNPINENDPAFPGETISVFATGLGATIPALRTGEPGPTNPPAATAAQPVVQYASQTATLISATMNPGAVGIYRITVRLTAEPVTGIRTIALTIGGVASGFAVSIPIGAAYVKPVISRVVSAAGGANSVQDKIQAGSWVSIYGSDLTLFTEDWTRALAASGGRLPIAVDGVKVTIDGKLAPVHYISPTQVNVQAPDSISGEVPVVVTFNGTSSAPFTAQAQAYAPAFFQWGTSKYAVATRYPDNQYVGGPILGSQWTAANAGDVVILWATGFGPTTPPIPAGMVVDRVSNVTAPVSVTVGGINAPVVGSALSAGLAGVYQVAIKLPMGIPPGDAPIKATVGGISTVDGVSLFVN